METKNIKQRGNSFNATVTVTNTNYNRNTFGTETSPEFLISNGAVVFQVRLTVAQSNGYINLLFVRFTKRCSDKLVYMISFKSQELNIVNKTFTSDDGTWHLIHENKIKQQFTFDVALEMHLCTSKSSFADLYSDTELTDFELRGDDGSVRTHRAVLAASSPVLRRMLVGAWRETAEGRVDVAGTSKATLESLKAYLYLHTLPETGVEQLLLLSSYYMMPELKQRCVDRLIRDLTAKNACDLIEFAAKNSVKRLLVAVLECVQNGAISVNEMRAFLKESDIHPSTPCAL